MSRDLNHYSDLYREMAELIGESGVRKLWQHYRGLTVTFPQRIYSNKYVREYIEENMDILKPSEIARYVGLSERRVRQIISELRKQESESCQNSGTLQGGRK